LNGLIKERADIGISEDKLLAINEVYIDSRYPGELGLVPDGVPTDKQIQEFIECAKGIKAIIMSELKKSSYSDTSKK
jgi:HEPN domain-containing protein